MSAYPGPFKCPDCGVWWAGFVHRCQVATTSGTVVLSGTNTCTCPKVPEGYFGDPPKADPNCPVHRYPISYTWGPITWASDFTGGK